MLKAGGAYLPLDPAYPTDRLAFMLDDAAPPVVLTHASSQAPLQAALDALAAPPAVIDLLVDAHTWKTQDATNLAPAMLGLGSRDLAYVIYTSGSTGRPKGVMIEHHSLVNRLVWMQKTYGFDSHSTILQKTPITFDVSVWELFGSLSAGACLVLARPNGHKDPDYLVGLMNDQQITIVHFVPSMLQAFVDHEGSAGCTSLKDVFCSGEALPAMLARRFMERLETTRLHNLYGPTEATVDVTAWTCPRPFEEDQPVTIGRPIDNTRAYILDPAGTPTPIGVVGELHLSGVGLARGYLNRQELTADKFIANPFVQNDRLYRTGDLARFLANGDIEYIGRNDFQVKLRGFRIELGEIEAQLAACPGIREAIALVREDMPGDKRLVAYYTTDAGAVPSAEMLTSRLAAALPEHMVPAAYIKMEGMPVTSNGKLDRAVLPAPDRETYVSKPYVAPVGRVENELAQIWSEVLGVGTIGRNDNFFELGGHSLLAVRMLERMKQSNLHANVLTIFKAPVLMQLAEAVQGERTTRTNVVPPAVPEGTSRITPEMVPLAALSQEDIDHIAEAVEGGMSNIKDIYPLTHLQEGILFHHLMETQSDPYLMWSLVRFGEKQALDAYVEALNAVIARHDICRTSVVWEGLTSPLQVVWRQAPLSLQVLTFDAAVGDVAEQLVGHVDPRHYRLDLQSAPLMRVYAAHDAASGQWLAIRMVHHLIDDVTTAQLLNHEVMAILHGGAAALPSPLPFKHVVARARHEGSNADDEAFFRSMLRDVTEATAPFNLLNVHGDGAHVVEARRRLPIGLSRHIRRKAKQLGVSAASLFHVAWAQVVARTAGRPDAVFGTVLFGRMSLDESADRIFGPFINTLPILVKVEGVGATEGVRATHRRLTELMSHEHASLALAQRCSGVAAPAPLFTAILNYRHAMNEAGNPIDGMTSTQVEELVSEERTNYPLVLNVDDIEEDFLTSIQVLPAVDPDLVCNMVRTALESLIQALEQEPDSNLQTLGVLPAEERHKILVDWNATATPYPAKRCIHELFEARAAESPDAIALRFQEHTLSYRQLNEQANRLARHLRDQGVAPGVQVAICVDRSPEMVIGLVAILKAGGAYVPLDASYPVDRLVSMLADARPQVAMVHAATRDKLRSTFAGLPVLPVVVDLQADAQAWANQEATNLPPALLGLGSRDLAYIIYTSGSTGKPKGIKVAHAPVINLIHWVNRTYQVDHNDCLLFITSISFDLSVYDIFGILAAGATIQMASTDQLADPQRLAEAVLDPRVTFWDSAPAALQLLVPFLQQIPRQNPSLRLIFNSGDWIPLSLPGAMADAFPNARFISLGGATEATIWSNHFEVHQVSGDWRSIPYGRPIQNARYYVLDAHLQPVPVGVIGNLYIAGPCLAEGYTDPQLTAERFVSSPWPDIPGPLYCTGDLARFFSNGDIEFIGRNDFQVKVRGFRIELGEIEAQLLHFPGVRDAIVMVREDVPGDHRLVAYYTTTHDADVSTERLLTHLGGKLPEYMVPAAYVKMDEMPVTSNGKQDRKALPAPDGEAYLSRPYQAPIGEIETELARIWSEVLGVEKVGRHDNFFELGGHSLLAVRIIEHMRRSNLQADIRTIFTTPVLADIAANTQEYGEIVL
ncbi:amino acid adenylation domain-containing protein [Stenotrophomonas sp. P5_B8]